MLTPSDLDKAGDLVAASYTQVEAEMLDYLVGRMISGNIADQRSQTAILLLAQSATPELERILDEHASEIDRAVNDEVRTLLGESDERDLAYVKKGLGVELDGITTQEMAATVRGIEGILSRHNIGMVEGAKDAFIKASTDAVVNVNAGFMTTERALHKAVRDLEGKGISVIQYVSQSTGAKTVANQVDVAVRRHIRTQIAQDGARRTEQIMDEAGIEFVEVSSHTGARPSHQEWEGRVYSRNGRKKVGGHVYEDFRTACHVGDIADGIYGANCRHSHGPYIPGMERTYKPNPEHPSGLSNDEVYSLSQKQREKEREIRKTKRELSGAKQLYAANENDDNLAEVLRLQQKLRGEQADMRALIDNANARCRSGTSVLQRSPRREWAGDMPKVTLSASAQTKQRALAVADLKDRCVRKMYPIYSEDSFGTVTRRAWGKLSDDRYYTLAMHGTPETVTLFGTKVDHKVVADIITRRKDYDGTKAVRLLSCSTGDDSGDAPCFAQRLADELGVQVVAPTDTVWVSTDGGLAVGKKRGDNTGSMKTFDPRPRS